MKDYVLRTLIILITFCLIANFTFAADRYWVGGSGNTNDTAHWSTSSGGAGGASVPTNADNCIFDLSSSTAHASYTYTVNADQNCLNFIMDGPSASDANKITWAGSSILNIYGDFNLTGTSAGITRTYTGARNLKATSGINHLLFNGVGFSTGFTFDGTGGTWIFDSNNVQVGSSTGWTFTRGNVSLNDYNLSTTTLTAGNNFSDLNLGSGTHIISGTISSIWNFPTAARLNAGTSTLIFNGALIGKIIFAGSGKTYYNVWNHTTNDYNMFVSGSNTFNELKIDAGRKMVFEKATTQTVSIFTAVGTAGNTIDLNSGTAGTQAKLSKSSGMVISDYLRIKDINATGGATWYAGSHSVDLGGNSGWIFSDPPGPTTSISGCGSTGWNKTDQTITLTPSNATSTQYRLDGGAWTDYTVPFTLSTDLNHQIDFNSSSPVGTEATKTSYCAIDKTSPTVGTTNISGFSTYSPGAYTVIKGTGNIFATASDALSGIASYDYTISDGLSWLSTSDSNATYAKKDSLSITNGTAYQFNLRATDNATNVGTGTHTGIYIGDTLAPTTNISGNSASWTSTNQTISLSCSDNGGQGVLKAGCKTTQYRIDGGAWTTYSGAFTISTDGNHQIDYNSSDNLDTMETTKTAYAAVDKTAPTVGTTTFNGFTTYTTYISGTGTILGGAATDSTSGINTSSCEYTPDNGVNWYPATWNTNHCEKTSFTIVNGTTYTANTRVQDYAGNSTTGAATAAFTGDTIAPTTTITQTYFNDTNISQIHLACTDAISGCALTQYRIDSGAWSTYSTDFNYTGKGIHRIDFNSKDNLGNTETTHSMDLNMPTLLTIKYPKNIATVVQLSEKWVLRSIGGVILNLTDLNTDRNTYVQPNTLTTLYVADVNGNYTQSTFTRTYYVDSNTGFDTLQPYLYAISTSLPTTINILNKNTLAALPSYTIKFYGNLPGIGYTLIGQGTTDSKGQILQLFIAGQNYTFDVYNPAGVFLQSYNYTAINSQAYIYYNFLNIDVNSYTPVNPTPNTDVNTVVADFYTMRNAFFNTCAGTDPCFPSALIAILLTIVILITATSISTTSGAFIGVKGLAIIAFCSFTVFMGIGFIPLFIYAFLGTITLFMAVLVQ